MFNTQKLLAVFSFLMSAATVSLSQAESFMVGSVPTQFGVNNGSVGYSIPIESPPGRGGMQPSLSLSYSGSGNDILGQGWTLTGLSAISRCPATHVQDGFTAGITFGEKDRYCLDGQRLIPVNGDNGSVGAEYRTEIDSYSRIRSYGGSNHNPEYFVVTTKAGHVITYGGGSATERFPQGNMSWSIRTVAEITGNNTVNYSYFFDKNTQYLDHITYSGGSVDLVYQSEDKPDASTIYLLGNTITTAKRLDKVVTYAYNIEQKQYRLTYQQTGLHN